MSSYAIKLVAHRDSKLKVSTQIYSNASQFALSDSTGCCHSKKKLASFKYDMLHFPTKNILKFPFFLCK